MVLQVWDTVSGFNFRHGETHTDPFLPFEHPLAEWRYYSPSNREGYFGQVWTNCWLLQSQSFMQYQSSCSLPCRLNVRLAPATTHIS